MSDDAESIQNDIPRFGFCPHFGVGAGGVASNAVVHARFSNSVKDRKL